jgi:hypothetical protein
MMKEQLLQIARLGMLDFKLGDYIGKKKENQQAEEAYQRIGY